MKNSGSVKSPPPSMSIFTEAPAEGDVDRPVGPLGEAHATTDLQQPADAERDVLGAEVEHHVARGEGDRALGERLVARGVDVASGAARSCSVARTRRWRLSVETGDAEDLEVADGGEGVGGRQADLRAPCAATMRALDTSRPTASGLREPSGRYSGPDPTNSSRPSPVVESPLKETVPSIVHEVADHDAHVADGDGEALRSDLDLDLRRADGDRLGDSDPGRVDLQLQLAGHAGPATADVEVGLQNGGDPLGSDAGAIEVGQHDEGAVHVEEPAVVATEATGADAEAGRRRSW